jgi:hypothetical protein
MESVHLSNRARIEIPRSVVESSLWLRAGFVGIAAAAIGLVDLIGGGMSAVTALMLILAGGPAGAWSLRRSWRLLEGGAEASNVEGLTPPRTFRKRGTALRAGSVSLN